MVDLGSDGGEREVDGCSAARGVLDVPELEEWERCLFLATGLESVEKLRG